MNLLGVAVLLGFCHVSMATPSTDIFCSSTCPRLHPQQHFCNSDTVLKARINSVEYIDMNEVVVQYRNESMYTRYNARAIRTYKEPAVVGVGGLFDVYIPSFVCSLEDLQVDQVYLFGGKVQNGSLTASDCDGFAGLFANLTYDQRRGLIERYENHCHFCQIEAAAQTKFVGGILAEVGKESGYWSREGCVYNPVPSAKYGGEDCESLYSFCVSGYKVGDCRWEGTLDYDNCYEKREDAWFSQEKGEPEYKCESQCLGLDYYDRWICLKDAMRWERLGNDPC